ncbi:uncharacterized protein JCM6883_003842 [Sporobolomyces salmoneus]|uniref:uncharacterized protein n=1 Tax=Sporobolomyces salmoneus TaxID=183962 RepID=UPI003177358B
MEPTQYWWNDTAIEYSCDERTPSEDHWKEFELLSAGTRMMMANAPYCNATATYRGGPFVSINGAISKNGSTWGCSLDGKQWTWYSAGGNGESWTGKVLCAWDHMNLEDDIRTWLASDPSGKTAIALGSWIGLPSDQKEEGKTSTMSFFPTISQPIPFDLEATTSSASTSTSSPSEKETSTGAQIDKATATATPKGKSIDVDNTSISASTSTSHADNVLVATNSADSSSSSLPSSTPSATNQYIVIGVGTAVVVGAILAFMLCFHQRSKRKNREGEDNAENTLLSSDDGSDDSEDSDDGHSRRSKKERR